MLGLCHFIFVTFTNDKFFTVTLNVTVTRVPRTFLELGKIKKNIFLKIKMSTIKSEKKNIYQTIHSTSFISIFVVEIFTIFLLFFSDFFNNQIPFSEKLQLCSVVPAHRNMQYLGELVFFHTPRGTPNNRSDDKICTHLKMIWNFEKL